MIDDLKKPAQLRRLHKKNKTKKLKTLKQNVLHPLLITISVISIIMFLFFNIAIILLLYSNIYSETRSMAGVIGKLATVEGNTAENAEQIQDIFKTELERRDISYRLNMVFLDEHGQTIETVFDYYGEEKGYLEEYFEKKISQVTFGEMKSIYTDHDLLLFSLVPIESNENTYIGIYASFRSLLNTVISGNKALLIILACSVFGFVLAAGIISSNISKPIKALSDHMDVIGDGDFTPVNLEANSSEMQKLIVSINEMLARLEAYDNAHTMSIQNLSHDLRTPLMSIGGYAEAIKYGVMDTEEAADVIIKESKRLTDVLEKILILSQLDTLNQPVNMTSVYLTDFIDEEIKSLDGYALQQNVLVHSVFERQNVRVLADVNLLSTIVRNLLSNAIRYAEHEVCVTVRDVENQTVLYVMDDGAGLTDEDLKYLFTRFYVGKTGHSGLGLSTSKSAADYMGCLISGENRNQLKKDDPNYAKTGAIFTVSFPKYE